jgi:endonuclease G
LLYNEKHEQADWVAYQITAEETIRKFQRSNKFVVDPLISTGSASETDYKGSGFDRGHLASAGDMGWSAEAMQESFYYSNMSPQDPAFNRGIWKNLEEQVRTWANKYNTLYVVTGPVLKLGLPTIGYNEVSIPEQYYKVILDYRLPEIKGIAFIMPNKGSKEPIYIYAVTIDSVETVTGIDFFEKLPDKQEVVIERNLCVDCWIWQISNQQNIGEVKLNSSQSVQCSGKTKAGARCKNKTLNPSGYCYIHENQINAK